ncbi:hypothetical protein B9Z55_000815 [Caenorhabditis nigoni]|uniref:Uncharacterized protein n=1 Tax=Caenorhabditis nigoni TaxID=1611254 RepID=A0A2G5VUY3_9PELO|nr:hypothetical protein B9Z55_000815 [Caenorhabditis nigoni]
MNNIHFYGLPKNYEDFKELHNPLAETMHMLYTRYVTIQAPAGFKGRVHQPEPVEQKPLPLPIDNIPSTSSDSSSQVAICTVEKGKQILDNVLSTSNLIMIQQMLMKKMDIDEKMRKLEKRKEEEEKEQQNPSIGEPIAKRLRLVKVKN